MPSEQSALPTAGGKQDMPKTCCSLKRRFTLFKSTSNKIMKAQVLILSLSITTLAPATRRIQLINTQDRMKPSLLSTLIIAFLATSCAVTINNPTASNPSSSKPSATQVPAASQPANRTPFPQVATDTSNTATIFQVSESTPPGLKIVNAKLVHNDGDVLTGDFRVYCPTSMIRPTNYVLKNAQGALKKQGSWWEPAFQPKWEVERMLVRQAC